MKVPTIHVAKDGMVAIINADNVELWTSRGWAVVEEVKDDTPEDKPKKRTRKAKQ